MPMADRLMVTHIDAVFEADTFFPGISPDEWYISEQEDYFSEEPGELSFSYTTYLRRR
jgi:dihydrofolate reductase